ncbi:MAG TPA: succinate dehydrogenase, hydrophobic membrane anchor protein [Caulobacteraceae bacterium]|jgi:succinate dehydrogenase / fumarate reductase membrane anchor subunit|nr:succinate dehydrogenase, hydrophobic membrane anchor protein [Caulobacteraceae bacterium]
MDVSGQYRTPLSRARGLGSAKEGVHRFIAERATAIALVPLSLWAVYAVLRVAPVGYEGAVNLLQSPVNAVLAVLLIAVSCAHMEAGMRVIIEDYVQKHGPKIALLLLNAGVCWLGGALGVFSILKVALLGVGA